MYYRLQFLVYFSEIYMYLKETTNHCGDTRNDIQKNIRARRAVICRLVHRSRAFLQSQQYILTARTIRILKKIEFTNFFY